MFLLNWVPLLLLVGETIPCHNILIIMFACSFFKCCCTAAWDLKFVFYYLYPMLFLSSLTALINCRLQYLNLLLLVVSSSIFYWAYARFDLLSEWWAWNFPLSLSISLMKAAIWLYFYKLEIAFCVHFALQLWWNVIARI